MGVEKQKDCHADHWWRGYRLFRQPSLTAFSASIDDQYKTMNWIIIVSENGLALVCTKPLHHSTGHLKNKSLWKLKQTTKLNLKEVHLKMSSAKWWPFYSGFMTVISFGVKSLPEPLLSFQLDPKEQTSAKLESNYKTFLWKNIVDDVVCKTAAILFRSHSVNSSPPSATYMRRLRGSALVQIMACRLIGAKPLSKPMLEYC